MSNRLVPIALRSRMSLPATTVHSGLAQPLLVEETTTRRFVTRTGYLLSAGTIGLLCWAGFTPVNEVARAAGAIIPDGYEQVIQHLDGGIVRQIYVGAGDIVAAGQPLFLVDDARTPQDIRTLQVRKTDAAGQVTLLSALLDDREPDLGALPVDARSQYLAERDARRSRLALLESQIEQAVAASEASAAQITGLETSLGFAQRERDRFATLAAKGFAPRVEAEARDNRVAELQAQLDASRQRLAAARSNVIEARQALDAYRAEARSTLSSRLQQARMALAEVEGELDKGSARQGRLTVTAPADGVIKSLEINTIGSVIQRGQLLGTLVPMGDTLVAEARLPVKEIAHVGVGKRALVKLTAFDFSRYGWIEGHVTAISPGAFTSPEGSSYFTVRVALDSGTPTNAPGAEILPGMDASIEVITGQRSILEYVLMPIRVTLASAFQER